MHYYCGRCLVRSKNIVQAEGKWFGITHKYMCPVCKSTRVLTRTEVGFFFKRILARPPVSLPTAQ